MSKKISVIVPVYNASTYIGRCIESVQAQTYKKWELILVDDGSKDDSLNICSEYASKDTRIHVIHQDNAGPGIARNTGIDMANGEYIVFIDSDDYIDRAYFDLLSKHDEDVVFIDVRNFDEDGRVLNEEYMSSNKRLSLDSILRSQMTGRISWGGWRKCLKIKVLQENNIRYTNHKIGEEAIYSFQALWYAKSVAFIEQPLYNCVQRGDSQSHLKVDDPWGGAAKAMKEKVTEMGLYPKFANTINAFFLTATVASANCLAKNYPFTTYLKKVRECRCRLSETIDRDYPIDKENMSRKARIVGWLLQHGFYTSIWILSKAKEKLG